MRILIIESESGFAEQLKGYINAIHQECYFLPTVSSIRESLDIVSTLTPDVIFMNINLSQSGSFELFRRSTSTSAIIFTTDDNQVTSVSENEDVAYIVKPFQKDSLREAFTYIAKSRELRKIQSQHLAGSFTKSTDSPIHKSRFLVKHGQKLIPVKTTEINHFSTEGSLVYLVTVDKRKYVIDEHLHELDNHLNPANFFRVNRKFILAKDAILSLDYHSKGQVLVRANLLEKELIVVSRQQTPVLKLWLSQ